jgi:hypothetical protein
MLNFRTGGNELYDCIASRVTEASEKRSEQKEYNRRNSENSDDDCLDVPRRLVDEGEVVHHVKKERRQCQRGSKKLEGD